MVPLPLRWINVDDNFSLRPQKTAMCLSCEPPFPSSHLNMPEIVLKMLKLQSFWIQIYYNIYSHCSSMFIPSGRIFPSQPSDNISESMSWCHWATVTSGRPIPSLLLSLPLAVGIFLCWPDLKYENFDLNWFLRLRKKWARPFEIRWQFLDEHIVCPSLRPQDVHNPGQELHAQAADQPETLQRTVRLQKAMANADPLQQTKLMPASTEFFDTNCDANDENHWKPIMVLYRSRAALEQTSEEPFYNGWARYCKPPSEPNSAIQAMGVLHWAKLMFRCITQKTWMSLNVHDEMGNTWNSWFCKWLLSWS